MLGVRHEKEGKLRVTYIGCDDAKVVLDGQVLELRWGPQGVEARILPDRGVNATSERGEPQVEQAPVPVRQGGWDKGTADASAHYVAAFRKDLSEVGVVEGQNVTVEYHWLGPVFS